MSVVAGGPLVRARVVAVRVDREQEHVLVGAAAAPRPPSTAVTIVAKLSSVRIMTAASLETSVPVMPMATPMSARFSAGASLTPSPVIATTLPLRLSRSTRRTLSSGATRATTPISSSCATSSLVAHRGELGAGERAALDAELARDRGGGRGVVAGDHPDPDAGVLALRDRGLRLRARRVDDADHREQRQVLDLVEQVAVRVERRGSKSRVRHHQHPHALAGDPVVLGQHEVAVAVRRARSRRRGRGSCVERAIRTSGAPLT